MRREVLVVGEAGRRWHNQPLPIGAAIRIICQGILDSTRQRELG
jgi:hypothetical protein